MFTLIPSFIKLLTLYYQLSIAKAHNITELYAIIHIARATVIILSSTYRIEASQKFQLLSNHSAVKWENIFILNVTP